MYAYLMGGVWIIGHCWGWGIGVGAAAGVVEGKKETRERRCGSVVTAWPPSTTAQSILFN